LKTLAISGGSGFLGRSIITSLKDFPLKIIATKRNEKKIKIPKFKNLKWIDFDLNQNHNDLFEVFEKPDFFIHLAWGNLPNYESNLHLDHEFEIQKKFLKELINQGLSNLLVTGTCFEYGNQEGKLKEITPVLPDNPYAKAKDNLRKFLFDLQREKKFNLVWARLFYTYGEGQNPKSIYSQFLKATKSKKKTFNMSLGMQKRDYLNVKELSKYLIKLSLLEKDCGIVNVCSGKPIRIRDLVEKWQEELGISLDINYGYYDYPKYEPFEFWGDPSKLNNLLSIENNKLIY
tara:strand:+ start:256 stop:1122 length:867 start_codon:yes stop_codon:yes gene_type:complete